MKKIDAVWNRISKENTIRIYQRLKNEKLMEQALLSEPYETRDELLSYYLYAKDVNLERDDYHIEEINKFPIILKYVNQYWQLLKMNFNDELQKFVAINGNDKKSFDFEEKFLQLAEVVHTNKNDLEALEKLLSHCYDKLDFDDIPIILSYALTGSRTAKPFLNEAKNIVKKNPDHWIGHFIIGEAYSQKSMTSEASQAFYYASILNVSNALVYARLGLQYLKLGIMEEAIKVLNKAVQAKPENEQVLYLLGTAYLNTGLITDGLNIYKKLQGSSYSRELLETALKLFEKENYPPEAIELFIVAINSNINYRHILYKLGKQLLIHKDLQNAFKIHECLKSFDLILAERLFNHIYQ